MRITRRQFELGGAVDGAVRSMKFEKCTECRDNSQKVVHRACTGQGLPRGVSSSPTVMGRAMGCVRNLRSLTGILLQPTKGPPRLRAEDSATRPPLTQPWALRDGRGYVAMDVQYKEAHATKSLRREVVRSSPSVDAIGGGGGEGVKNFVRTPPPPAHARPCLSTGRALNRCFEEILGPLFLWSIEDGVFVECLYRERGKEGLSRVCDSALCS